MKQKKPSNYITIKDSRKIIKYNIKQMKYYEALKKKKLSPEEYTSVMKDPNNIIEIDNLCDFLINLCLFYPTFCELSTIKHTFFKDF